MTGLDVRNTPKVVGGFSSACTERATSFYRRTVDDVMSVAGTREAEMAKLLENTYRHVNIALVNEMAIFCHDLEIDLRESIRAASTKPFGFTAFHPGPGVGGHCIPIDPSYLSHHVRTLWYQFRFVELAQEVSNRMPPYVVMRVQSMLNEVKLALNGSNVLVLGLTYQPDIADDRESPAEWVVRGLRMRGANMTGHDPHLDRFEVDGEPLPLADDLADALAHADVTVLLQAHSQHDLDRVATMSQPVFDTRGVMSGHNVERL